jgi:hypothetical protein
MLNGGLGKPFGILTMILSRNGMLLGVFVFALIVMVSRLAMVMRRGFVFRSG